MPTSSNQLTVVQHVTPLTHHFRTNAFVLKYSDPLSRFALMLTHPDFLDVLAWSQEVDNAYSTNKKQGLFLYHRNREIILTYYLQIIRVLAGTDHLLTSSPQHLEQTYKALIIQNRKSDKLFKLIHDTLNKQPNANFQLFFNAILQSDYLQAQQLLYGLDINPPNQIWRLAFINPNHVGNSAINHPINSFPNTPYEALLNHPYSRNWNVRPSARRITNQNLYTPNVELSGILTAYLFSKGKMHPLFEPERSKTVVILGLASVLVGSLFLLNVWAFCYFKQATSSFYMLAGLIVSSLLCLSGLEPHFNKSILIALIILLIYFLVPIIANFNFIFSALVDIGFLAVTFGAVALIASVPEKVADFYKNSILFSIALYSTALITFSLLLIPRLATIASIPIAYIIMSAIYLPSKLAYNLLQLCFQSDHQQHFKTQMTGALDEYKYNLNALVNFIKHYDRKITRLMYQLIEPLNTPLPFYYRQHEFYDNPQLHSMMSNARLVYAANLAKTQTVSPKEHLICLLKHYLQPSRLAAFFKTTKPHAQFIQTLLNEFENDTNLTMSYADFKFSTEESLNSELIGIGEYIRYVLVPMDQKNHYETDPSPDALQRFFPALL